MTKEFAGGYELPALADYDRICIQVSVPNNQQHIAAFMGQLEALGWWNTWQRDGLKYGQYVAATWRDIFDQVSARYEAGEFESGECVTMDCDAVINCLNGRIRIGVTGLEALSASGVWTPITGSTIDPRTQGTVAPPYTTVPAGQQGNCLAAANIIAFFKEFMRQTIATLISDGDDTPNTLAYVQTAYGEIFGTSGLLAQPDMRAYAIAAAGYGNVAIAAAMTEPVYTALDCILFCDLASDGFITDARMSNVYHDASGIIPALAGNLFTLFMNVFGKNGLMLMETRAGIVTADCTGCTECSWCWDFDFTLGEQGWTGWAGGGYPAVLVSGAGWQNTPDVGRGDIQIVFGRTIAYRSAEVFLGASGVLSEGTGSSLYDDSGQIAGIVPRILGTQNYASPDASRSTTGFIVTDGIGGGAIGTIIKIRMRGQGDNPFGADNCSG
jgi:hypothetical protein